MLLRISWRNIWRNKTRSFVIIAAIALGLWGGIFSTAFMNGMAEQQIFSTIHTETGNIQLNAKNFLLNYDILQDIPNADSIVKTIEKISGVAGVSPRIQMTAMASTATSSTGIMINAVDPTKQIKVSNLYESVIDGNYFEGDGDNPIVIGQQLADKLHAKIHSRIVMTLQTTSGDITYGAFKVTGIFRTHNTDFDKLNVFVLLKDLQRLINFPDNTVSVITLLLNNTDDTKVITTEIKKQFPDLQVQGWQQLSPMLQAMSGTMEEFSLIFVGIILIALAFGIINTMLMAVLDRTREIGMLMSIGMSPGKVFRMIVLETILLSLTGAAIGVLLSVGTIVYFGKAGINLSIIGEGVNALGYSSMVYPQLGIGFYVQLAILVIIISIIAGIFPALRAIRMNPAEAVRGE